MRSKSRITNSIVVAAFLLMILTAPLFGQQRGPIMGGGIISPPANQRPPGLEFVGIEQHLNAEVPADLEFKDELGNPVKLADYFGHGRPVILNLGYYQCPMLCSELLQGLVGSMKALTFNLGKDFDVLTVSFDPRETTEMAAAKKRDMMKRYGRPNSDQGWHFLTGKPDAINALTKAVGQVGDHHRGLGQPIGREKPQSQIDRHLGAVGGGEADFAPACLVPAVLPERLE